MSSFGFDLRYAVRMLLKHRLLAASAIATMALAISANTTIFSLVYGVLLKPLSLPEADRVVRIEEQHRGRRLNLTGATFVDLHDRTRTLQGVSAYRIFSPGLSETGTPEQVTAAEVTQDYFAVLGAAPAMGRWFTGTDFRPGSPRTAIVSDRMWRRRFGADLTLIGKRVSIDGVPVEIVGIAPDLFAPGVPDVWIPASSSLALLRNRRAHLFTVIGRVKPQVSVELAQREVAELAAAIDRDSGSVDPDLNLVATPLQARMVQSARPAILTLWAGVSLVMLIAAANIANLLLMHGNARGRELSIRIALGASRARIARQLAIESVLLTCVGGVVGTCLGIWSVPALRAALPASIPRAADLTGDPRVVLFGVLVSVVMAMIFSMPFALRSSSRHPLDALRSRSTAGSSQSRSRSILVVAEVTLTVMLLAAAGLLGRSLWTILQVEPGFNSANVLTLRLSLPDSKYSNAAAHSAFYETVIERVAAVPGIAAAGVTGALPLTGTPATTIEPEGSSNTDQLSADVITATPGFFTALKIPLRQGRLFAAIDLKGARPVVLINEAAARRFWPERQNVLGRTITMKDWGAPYQAEVVGIVGNIHQAGADSDVAPAVYYPFAQFPETTLTQYIVVRTTGSQLRPEDPTLRLGQTISALKNQVWAVDPGQAIASIRTMDDIMAASVADRRFNLLLLTAFALAAVLLSGIGIYGIVAFAIAERTREIGIRMALGAQARDLVLLVLSQGARPVAAGIAAGMAGTIFTSRLLQALLFGVQPTDVMTLIGVVIAIGVVATAACAGPIRRALRTDPVIALRIE